MAEPKPDEKIKIALAEFTQISNVLAVPTLGGPPLPEDRKWTLPLPDERAFADHPDHPRPCDEVQSAVGQAESKTGESYIKDSPIQTRRK